MVRAITGQFKSNQSLTESSQVVWCRNVPNPKREKIFRIVSKNIFSSYFHIIYFIQIRVKFYLIVKNICNCIQKILQIKKQKCVSRLFTNVEHLN